jgi:hypothetical protein
MRDSCALWPNLQTFRSQLTSSLGSHEAAQIIGSDTSSRCMTTTQPRSRRGFLFVRRIYIQRQIGLHILRCLKTSCLALQRRPSRGQRPPTKRVRD